MKDLKTILFITSIFIACTATQASAQKASRISSGRAAYGYPNEKVRAKSKQKKKSRKQRRKQEKSPAYRKKSNWAG